MVVWTTVDTPPVESVEKLVTADVESGVVLGADVVVLAPGVLELGLVVLLGDEVVVVVLIVDEDVVLTGVDVVVVVMGVVEVVEAGVEVEVGGGVLVVVSEGEVDREVVVLVPDVVVVL